jgi:hypothetical protein
MANTKISALTSATTPVAGTEVLPIVQSSATVKLAISDITPGLSTISATKGGTGQTSYAVGDLLYASTTTALSKLADVATGSALISGGVGVAPSYGKIGLTTHVSGTLPTANGGTNLTSFTTNGVVYASSTSALATGSALVFDGANLGIGVTPSTWATVTPALQIGGAGSFIAAQGNSTPAFYTGTNASFNGSNFIYKITNVATMYVQDTGEHKWYRAASGTAGNTITFSQPMMVDANGYLLVGYTSSNGAYKLQVNSQIFATSSTIATSDGRYKQDVIPLTGSLNDICALNPVQFSWKKHPVHNFDTDTPTIGFIAQEVQEVLKNKPYLNSIIKKNDCVIEPEEKDSEGNITKQAVTEEFFGIAEGNMIALLTKAIQEQQVLITQLTERISALEGK